MNKMFDREEGEVILELDYHNSVQFNVLQEGQFMLELLKVKNMLMPLRDLIYIHIGEYCNPMLEICPRGNHV